MRFPSSCTFSHQPLFLPQNLGGHLPTELGLLSSAEFVSLRNNQFTGTIPSELGLVTTMTEFRLGSNDISGTIPAELGYEGKANMVVVNSDASI